jgi:glycosyltransferase involved in cell wall biosynthesis
MRETLAEVIRVLHVTEILDGGISDFLKSLAEAQVVAGANVTIAFPGELSSKGTTSKIEDFPSNFGVILIKKSNWRFLTTFRIRRYVKKTLISGSFDVIHLHSTYAGVAGRTFRNKTLKKSKVFYSPHGLSFLRTNSNLLTRKLFLLCELILARRKSRLILTSESEKALVSSKLKPIMIPLTLKNGVDADVIIEKGRKYWNEKPKIAMIGRVSYQKAPWRFQRIAEEFIGKAEFYWIGFREGDRPFSLGLDDTKVNMIPWMNRTNLLEFLDQIDILLFPTLWEGFSLSVPLAQARGIPALVSDVIGNKDSVEHGFSGFVCSSENEMKEQLSKIIGNPIGYPNLSLAAISHARSNLSNINLGIDSLTMYTRDI